MTPYSYNENKFAKSKGKWGKDGKRNSRKDSLPLMSSSKFIMLVKVLIHFAFKCRIMFFSTVKLVQGFWNASFNICHSNVFVMCSKTFHNLNSKERIIFIWTIKNYNCGVFDHCLKFAMKKWPAYTWRSP